MSDAKQYPERKRRAKRASAPDGAGPVAHARGSDRVLNLHKQLAAAKMPHGKTAVQRQIDASDRQIDRLAYDLYDLTDDEPCIVEQ